MTDALEAYLQELHVIHASTAAVKETSGYGALASLLNAYGDKLKPKVHCIIQLRNDGAGLPDGGLFTPDQLKNTDEEAPLRGIPLPSRGVIEVKSADADLNKIAETDQVRDYVKRYGLVLLTNYWRFILLRRSDNSSPIRAEHFQLAENEAGFWQLAGHPRKGSQENGQQFAEYIKRVLLHRAALDNPRDVAFFLASYARDARARVEKSGDLPALQAIRAALEEALGMKFEAERGEHFFRSTLVQTLFYGVFSAWVLWHKEKPLRKSDFDWKSAAWTLHVPMIKALFEQVATPTKLGPLQLVEVLDWTADALNRVERLKFFERFIEDHAVQYFYEPFLAAFDPELRKELGVWYTPPEIVQYQVARVDTALREELDIPDGLADQRVFVLDPCCGTGAYLLEVLRVIARTLEEEKGEGALAELAVKDAAQNRVFGFEIMPAPFVVAHLQMGLILQKLAVPLDEKKHERAGIFLTNSLTGWDFAGENPHLKNWPELEAERAGAGRVKQEKPILVILGNPPYNAFAGTSPEEEAGLVEPYKEGLVTKWGIKKFNLDDLYVRFFRLAERRIAEKTGKGIVCYITNFSYLEDTSFVTMRERFLKEFDSLWFDCLNGDSRETGKLTPEGKPDPSIFSTEYNREGIRVGTAISLLVRKGNRDKKARVLFRQYWGVNKRAEIVQSLEQRPFGTNYKNAHPAQENGFAFVPLKVSRNYLQWPAVVDIARSFPFNGPIERRGNSLIVFAESRKELVKVADYLDPKVSDQEIARAAPQFMTSSGEFDAVKSRATLKGKVKYKADAIVPYPFKPFDLRVAYLDSEIQPLFSRPSPDLLGQRFEGNCFFVTRDTADKMVEGPPFYFSPVVCDYDCISGHARHFPIRLNQILKNRPKKDADGNGEFDSILEESARPYVASGIVANLSEPARAYLTRLRVTDFDSDAGSAALIWLHALAIGHSPEYLSENRDGVRRFWPRIPLPDSKKSLFASAALGRTVANLLNTLTPLEGVTSGKLRSEFKTIALLSSANDLSVSAGWGFAGQGGVTMPGKGKLVSSPHEGELGSKSPWSGFYDVYLNDSVCWSHVPTEVWDYTIGGYQVIKKWLSYRDYSILKRPITPDEAREVTHMARRIAALILLQPDLDKNYAAIKASAANWSDFKA